MARMPVWVKSYVFVFLTPTSFNFDFTPNWLRNPYPKTIYFTSSAPVQEFEVELESESVLPGPIGSASL